MGRFAVRLRWTRKQIVVSLICGTVFGRNLLQRWRDHQRRNLSLPERYRRVWAAPVSSSR